MRICQAQQSGAISGQGTSFTSCSSFNDGGVFRRGKREGPMIILSTLNSKEGYRRRIPLDQGLIQKGPHRWCISAQGRGPLGENCQRHGANLIVSHGAVDDLNVKDDTVVVNWPECAYGLDERRDVEELLSAEMQTTRDRSGRLGVTLVVVLAVQQRIETRVAHVHDCLDGGYECTASSRHRRWTLWSW